MAHPPAVRFRSPFDPHGNDSVEALPHWVLQGLTRGLLSVIGLSAHTKKKFTQRWTQRAERICLALGQGLVKSQPPDVNISEQVIDRIALEVRRQLWSRSLAGHSYAILNMDSDKILEALTRTQIAGKDHIYDKMYLQLPYDEVDRLDQRIKWLTMEVPGLLDALHQNSLCLNLVCVKRRAAPPPPSHNKIMEWAENPSAARLRDNLLGHFHNKTAKRIRRVLSDRPKN